MSGACAAARPQILAVDRPRPEGRIAGRDVSRAEAIAHAARLLAAARRPLVWGLGRASCEAQAVAVKIAQLLQGVISTPGSDEALQTVGEVSATLGEMRQRADLQLSSGTPIRWQPIHGCSNGTRRRKQT